MKINSIGKNFVYNTLFTIVNTLFPLITAPYLSFILGAENIGKVNYATAIVGWATLFASFGIPRYGIREIARKRDNKKEMSNAFWNLLLIQLILSLFTIIIYLGLVFTLPILQSDIKLYLLMVLMIVLNIFSIDWFYQGLEEYGFIAKRNIFVKVISIFLIFIMIKDREHYLLYAFINILGLSFNNILNYLNSLKYIDKTIYSFKFLFYFKELRVYFMTTFIIALYTQLDQTLLGGHSQKDLAYYVRSRTILGLGLGIVNSLITVFIPRTAYLMEKNYNEYKFLIKKSINYIYILALPCVVGILFLSEEVMFMLGGEEFLPATVTLQIISLLVLINSIGTWQINQILIPYKLEKIAFYIQCIAAFLSVILNILLIPKYSYIGAAITWVLVESILVLIGSLVIKYKCQDIKIEYFNTSLMKYLIALFFMGMGLMCIKFMFSNYIVTIFLSLLLSPLVYFLGIFIMKEKIFMDVFYEIVGKFSKR